MPNHTPASHPSGTTFFSEGSQGEKKGNLGKPLAHDSALGDDIMHLRSFCYLPCFISTRGYLVKDWKFRHEYSDF